MKSLVPMLLSLGAIDDNSRGAGVARAAAPASATISTATMVMISEKRK